MNKYLVRVVNGQYAGIRLAALSPLLIILIIVGGVLLTRPRRNDPW